MLVDQHGQIRIIGFGVDAALRGLPAGRIGVDEIDLAGLLYCALTGKWAGASESAVPPAPEVHGEVLRPRRVRAGIPRMLDALCDQVLNPQHAPGGDGSDFSARAIRDLLHDYVGDLTGTHVAGPGASPGRRAGDATVPVVPSAPGRRASPSPTRSPTPDPAVRRPERPSPPEPSPHPPPPRRRPPPVDLPTQAGMPVFHDDDEVDWLRARAEQPEPPPPLEEPAAQAALRSRPARGRARTPPAPRQPRRDRQPGLLAVGRLAGLLGRREPRLRRAAGRAATPARGARGRGRRTAGAPARASTTPATRCPGGAGSGWR